MVVGSVFVFTVTADITGDSDVVIQSSVRVSWSIGEERDEGDSVCSHANTSIHRRPVAHVATSRSPAASIRNRSSLGIDVVLRRGGRIFPGVVICSVHIGQREGSSGRGIKRNSFTLSTRVVSTANSDVLAEAVFDLDASCTLCANLGNRRSAQLKFSIAVAVETTDGLASATLGLRPLRLLISSRACVRAERICSASASGDSSFNIADGRVRSKISSEVRGILNTRPSAKSKPVEINGTVSRWEIRAINGTAGELSINVATGGAA